MWASPCTAWNEAVRALADATMRSAASHAGSMRASSAF
jgi:hypothetical protein